MKALCQECLYEERLDCLPVAVIAQVSTQSFGPATKTATFLGYDVIGFLKGFEGLADPPQWMPLNLENTWNILDQGGTILGSTNKGRFSAKVGTDETRRFPL